MNDEMIKKEEELLKALEGVLAEIKDWRKVHHEAEAVKDKVPEMLDFNFGEFIHFVDIDGSIDGELYNSNYHYGLVLNHRAFKSADMAKLFAEKTQFIADCLFWKELHDRDYVPDWTNDREMKFFIYYTPSVKTYAVSVDYTCDNNYIYFSGREIAEQLADWLNSRKSK